MKLKSKVERCSPSPHIYFLKAEIVLEEGRVNSCMGKFLHKMVWPLAVRNGSLLLHAAQIIWLAWWGEWQQVWNCHPRRAASSEVWKNKENEAVKFSWWNTLPFYWPPPSYKEQNEGLWWEVQHFSWGQECWEQPCS